MPATKLTLRLEEALISAAKQYAADTGKSVSQLVADYFHGLLHRPQSGKGAPPLPPLVRALKGSWKGKRVSLEDYRQHLAEKHR